MATEVTNIEKFLAVGCLGVEKRWRKGISFTNSKNAEAQYQKFISDKVKDFSQVGSVFLITIRWYVREGASDCSWNIWEALQKNDEDIPDIVFKLLPVSENEKVDGSKGKGLLKKYFPNDPTLEKAFKSFCNKVEAELERRKNNVQEALEHYGLEGELKGDDLYNPKAVKRALKSKLAEKFGFTIEDEHLKSDKEIRQAINAHLREVMSKVTSLEQLDRLYARYTSAVGCDLINGFLRGNLSLDNNAESKKGAWGLHGM